MQPQEMLQRGIKAPRQFIKLMEKITEHSIVHVFEGKFDRLYYLPRIKKYVVSHDIQFYTAMNKSNVLSLYKYVSKSNTYKDRNVYFYIDRDAEPQPDLDHTKIYETPYYAIENFYCTNDDRLVNDFLNEVYGLNDSYKDIRSQLCQIHKKYQDQILDFLDPYNYYLYYKQHSNDIAKTITEPRFDIDNNTLINNHEEANIEQLQVFSQSLNYEEYDHFKKDKQGKRHTEYKVKSYLNFLSIFFNKVAKEKIKELLQLRNNSSTESQQENEQIMYPTIGRNEILHDLTDYAVTPKCLIQFLEHIADKKPK